MGKGKTIGRAVFLCSVFLCLLGKVTSQSAYYDPCTILPRGSAEDGTVLDVFSNNTCTNGSLWWNYPRGSLRLHFRSSDATKQFKVCLGVDIGASFRSIFDVTNGGHRPVPVPQERGTESCTDTVASEIILLIKSPTYLTYMTLHKYRLVFQY
ncbi:hypothetical protein SNE40_008126 [Patella caerulea]|uniref:Uncharacterized protein n=1 Tax=Patella caerulea TaxID=87958 RepID=A0AAN8K0Q8_PATCE